MASSLRSGTAAAGGHIFKAQRTGICNHALAFGFSHGYEVPAGIAVLALLVSLIFIRVKKPDLEGINPMAAPGAIPACRTAAQRPFYADRTRQGDCSSSTAGHACLAGPRPGVL